MTDDLIPPGRYGVILALADVHPFFAKQTAGAVVVVTIPSLAGRSLALEFLGSGPPFLGNRIIADLTTLRAWSDQLGIKSATNITQLMLAIATRSAGKRTILTLATGVNHRKQKAMVVTDVKVFEQEE